LRRQLNRVFDATLAQSGARAVPMTAAVEAATDARMIRVRHFVFALASLWAAAAAAAAPVCGYSLVKTHPHDAAAFTEGLFFRDGVMFESTGLEGKSVIRRWRLADGRVLGETRLPPELFGEGIVDWQGEIISLTWRNGVGFRWDMATLKPKARFGWRHEGWGLTHDGRSIIASDGSPVLRFFDPLTLVERRSITVTDAGQPIANLNELEWVRGEILANVWTTDRIARIDPANGRVKAWLDLAKLRRLSGASGPDAVLNGIAYDYRGDRLFVTGKNWPKLFEIRMARC
jgi:glutamine cyclotransferase